MLDGNIIGRKQLPHASPAVDNDRFDSVAQPLQRVLGGLVPGYGLAIDEGVIDDIARMSILGNQQSVSPGEEGGVDDDYDRMRIRSRERNVYTRKL